MNKEIVWIFGPSASGKNTFIDAATHDPAIKNHLGWAHKRVIASQASLKFIGQHHNDPIRKKRSRIPDEVATLLQNHDVVLIKWQYEDFAAERITHIQHAFPHALHHIILLELPDEQLAARLLQKPWWRPNSDPKPFIDDERKVISSFLQKLTLPITLISSANDENYALLP